MTLLLNLLPIFKKFWKQITAVLILSAAVWQVWSAITTYGQERYDAGFAKRDAQYKDELEKVRADYVKQVENLQKVNNEISTSYQDALSDIRDRSLPRPVRVCNDDTSSGVPKDSGTDSAGGHHATAEEGFSQAPGPDIGPFLYGEADTADALAAQVEHLQSWIRNVCMRPDNLRTAL